ncbi:MAG: hypothetical protein K0U41_06295 [Gammaproteobacteria bacterium]|nr:hypothetical protein [Gammaproteobacteria bacterium]
MMLVSNSFRQFIGKHYHQPHFQLEQDNTTAYKNLYMKGAYGHAGGIDHADAMMAMMRQRNCRPASYQEHFPEVFSHHVEYIFNLIHDTNEIIEHFLNKKVT